MGETVEFPCNGSTASGHLVTPPSGAGPGVLVIQEWWGLVPQIRRVCDRLGGQGFVALAPDLYHGEMAAHTEMDKAGRLMSELPPDRAARDMGGAVDFLLGHQAVKADAVGVTGFCMGGALSWVVAALQGPKIGAAVPYYGAPMGDMAPDWSGLVAPVLGHFAENDTFFPVEAVRELEASLKKMGKDVTFVYYPGMGHAFTNEDNALGTYNAEAAQQAWQRTVEFFHKHLG